jgi:ATP-binding cassette subfamily F protein uup
VSLTFGEQQVLRLVTWRLGPGDRVALVGVNGSGKSSLIKLLSGELEPSTGEVSRGATVRLAHLSQDATEIPGELRVLESLEQVRSVAVLNGGREITAGMLCDRFGFRGEKAYTLVSDLSGGERRRLQLMRLLMGEPNVLLLDEPTNDLDIETLTALEDLLDNWPGTLVVVSHDRYFVERVCDNVYALSDEHGIRHLPGGIDQYIELRRGGEAQPAGAVREQNVSAGAAQRLARKEIQRSERDLKRLEREIELSAERERTLHEQMAASATDHDRLLELQAELDTSIAQRERSEAAWLEGSQALEE